MSQTPNPPAGWYPDPANGEMRYWNGEAWAEPPAGAGYQPYGGQPYGGQPGQSPYPSQVYGAPANVGNTLSIIGIVMGCIAFIFCPPGFGIAGIVLGIVGKNKGESLGTIAITVSVIGLIGGMIIGFLVYDSMYT